MAPSRASAATVNLNTAYSLSLLSEYTHTLDTLPLDLSRNFADLRELDAVLSSSMASITSKINALTQMIEQGTSSKEERLWLLTEIAEEATRVKLGGDDKIRVTSQATDNVKHSVAHLRNLAENIPDFDVSTLNRKTTYPHVSTRSYMPAMSLDTGRRRRGGQSSLLVSSSHDLSPAKKRQRVLRDDNGYEIIRSPRKEKTQDSRSRARTKKSDRPASPSESILSVTSHTLAQPNTTNGSSRAAAANSNNSRSNGTASNNQSSSKRSRASANQHANNRSATPHNGVDHPHEQNGAMSNHHLGSNGAGTGAGGSGGINAGATSQQRGNSRDAYNGGLTASAASHHPSLAMSYQNGNGANPHAHHPNPYDIHVMPHQSIAAGVQDWNPPMAQQLEGPGMPVSRGHTVMPIVPVNTVVGPGIGAPATMDTTDAGDDGDGDDNRRYCICNGVSYGEMIACDDRQCDREWFHLSCINLSLAPQGQWFCESCRNKRYNKRANRGGKRRAQTAQRAVSRGRVF